MEEQEGQVQEGQLFKEPVSQSGSNKAVGEEKYVQAIVRPKQPASSYKYSLIKIGVAFFCGGLGIGIGFGALSSIRNNASMRQPVGEISFQSKQIGEITYTDAADMDGVVVNIAKQIGPCVVSVYNNKKVTSSDMAYYFADKNGEVLSGLGSGIIFQADDQFLYVMTNSHVVEGADSLAVNFLGDIKAACELVGKDSENDVAVVKVAKHLLSDDQLKKVAIAPLGDSDLLEAGQLAVAIGTPATDALNNTVTRGIISAAQRTITIAGVKMTVIQTDAAINPGNSGGALVGPTGEVIGMNVAKTIDTEGIGFALPINIVKPIVADLMVNGSVVRPALGITGLEVSRSSAKLYDLPIGIYIEAVMTGGSADLAGIKPKDILIQFEGETITNMDQLKGLIAQKRVGDVVEVKVIRNGSQKTFRVQLKEMPQ